MIEDRFLVRNKKFHLVLDAVNQLDKDPHTKIAVYKIETTNSQSTYN